MRAWAALAVLLIAGCIQEAPAATDDVPDERPSSLADTALAQAPETRFDAVQAIDWWEHISTAFTKHDSYTPNNDALRDHLVDELRAIGMDVEVRDYQAYPRDPTEPPVATTATEINAIIATKPGLAAIDANGTEHRIGLVSHYDTQAGTIHGAYDDKSGVAAEFHICKALAATAMDKTLTCIFFDAEEQGLVASARYIQDIQDEPEYVYDFVLGYDMTGINWPGHEWKMYVMTGPADDVPWLQPLAQDVMHGHLGYPEEGVEVLDTHDRNSDERRFKEAGIPIYRFAGGRHAADYDQYHGPLDTVDHVYDVTDGRANFEAGFTTIVQGSLALIQVLDAYPPQALRDGYA